MFDVWLNVDSETCVVVPLARAVAVLDAGVIDGPSDDGGVETDGTEADSTEKVVTASVEVGKLFPDDCERNVTVPSDEDRAREVVLVELKGPSVEDSMNVDRSDLGISCAEVV